MVKTILIYCTIIIYYVLQSTALVQHHTMVNNEDIVVSQPWVRLAPPNAPALGVFMTIENNTTKEARLVRVSSTQYETLQLHRTTLLENGIMNMARQDYMPLPANSKLQLKPGSWHIMIIKPESIPEENQVVKIKLEFKNGMTKTVDAIVKKG